MRKSHIFCYFCFVFIIAIALSSFVKINFFYSFVILLVSIVIAIIYWHHPNQTIKIIALGGLFLFLCFLRFKIYEPEINKNKIAYYNNQTIEFTGQITAEPDIRFDKTKLIIGNVETQNFASLQGKILINTPNYPAYYYGDWLQIKCELQSPGIINDFDYGEYLAIKNIYSVCYSPEFVGVQDFEPLPLPQKIYKKILNIKYKSKQIINNSLPFPHSEIASAMLLGLKRDIPQNILDNFSASGLSHIIAISGLHISIVGLLLMNLLIAIYFTRKRAFWISSVFIIIFLIMIGFRASSIRAGIMGFLAMYALSSGRLKSSINALLFTACVLLIINPKLLIFDIGFQLSFLAVSGIIYLHEYIDRFLYKIKIPEFFQIRSSLSMTLSAQVLVLPLIVYYFGNLSIIAPLANILVLPLLPFIMVGGFILIFLGFIFSPLAGLFGYILQLGLKYILFIADKLSINFNIHNLDFIWILIIYIFLIWGIWLIKQKKYIS